MRTRKVSIVETQDGWMTETTAYKSAIEALAAIQAEDRDAATAAGSAIATIIEWTATTRIGRAVLVVIAKTPK